MKPFKVRSIEKDIEPVTGMIIEKTTLAEGEYLYLLVNMDDNGHTMTWIDPHDLEHLYVWDGWV